MLLIYILIFVLLVFFSAFFSSAETSLLSLNKIKLNLQAKKKNKKANLLTRILEAPEEFFSTILIGNNFVNIAAASISTIVFTKLIGDNEQLILLVSTLATTVIILLFAEIIPKSYAFRYSEKISYLYAYPIKFFSFLFRPLVKGTTLFSRLFLRRAETETGEKPLTTEEIKHFLSSQMKTFQYHPDALRMLNEIIDITGKEIKSIMTPRLNLVALEENADAETLKKIILEKKLSKIPVYRDTLDHITGIIHTGDILATLLVKDYSEIDFHKIMRRPVFISEYSSLNYALKQFKKHRMNMAVVIDEYGSSIGILTLNDIFKEILGEIHLGQRAVRKIAVNTYMVTGNIPVEEVNEQLHLDLPDKPDYSTMSGLFVYFYGKLPQAKSVIRVNDVRMVVKRMGRRKIDDLLLIIEEKQNG